MRSEKTMHMTRQAARDEAFLKSSYLKMEFVVYEDHITGGFVSILSCMCPTGRIGQIDIIKFDGSMESFD